MKWLRTWRTRIEEAVLLGAVALAVCYLATGAVLQLLPAFIILFLAWLGQWAADV